MFSAGGSGPSYPLFDFGRDTIGLIRGVAPEDLVGSRAAVANLDLRVPLARLQRGAGSWPVFFRTLHAAAFVDAGHAWDTAFRAADLRTSTGAELSLDVVILHYVPLTLVTGAAWTRDPVADRSRAAFFGRIGHAFSRPRTAEHGQPRTTRNTRNPLIRVFSAYPRDPRILQSVADFRGFRGKITAA